MVSFLFTGIEYLYNLRTHVFEVSTYRKGLKAQPEIARVNRSYKYGCLSASRNSALLCKFRFGKYTRAH